MKNAPHVLGCPVRSQGTGAFTDCDKGVKKAWSWCIDPTIRLVRAIDGELCSIRIRVGCTPIVYYLEVIVVCSPNVESAATFFPSDVT